ncbi:MAG: fructose-specific PTS transporter subunit EIIC, partial [Turicibacter sp.]|nr:fructose-specific PTS transporter subunit EIIC [Turicibacter sp.]
EMARFNGKPLLERPVAEGIRKPQELLELVLSPNAPIYRSNQHIAELETAETASIGKKFYKHLMGGVSTMLPVVVGGGILIAIAFLVDQLIGVPQDSLGSLGSYNTLAAYFMTIGGAAFGFMLPILAGFIAYSIADKPGLAAGLVAGYLASSGDSFAGGEPVSSGFLGAIVGGFVAGGIILSLKKVFAGLPKSLEGIKTILLYPVLGILLTGLAMFVLNIPMSGVDVGLTNFLNSLSGTSAVLMGALVGGMMAIDMGGPINKAAYVFGTGTLAATVAYGGSEVMAAVMAGGMTPPLAIFLASLIFKKKFNAEEKNGALTNIVMGASFITEGAIPFAAADPARAIPSFMIGSAVAGALVSAAGIRLMAPHGGIFVLALTNNPLLYLAFILLGSLVSALLFGWSKKSKGHL